MEDGAKHMQHLGLWWQQLSSGLELGLWHQLAVPWDQSVIWLSGLGEVWTKLGSSCSFFLQRTTTLDHAVFDLGVEQKKGWQWDDGFQRMVSEIKEFMAEITLDCVATVSMKSDSRGSFFRSSPESCQISSSRLRMPFIVSGSQGRAWSN